jgi:hypothetical protein
MRFTIKGNKRHELRWVKAQSCSASDCVSLPSSPVRVCVQRRAKSDHHVCLKSKAGCAKKFRVLAGQKRFAQNEKTEMLATEGCEGTQQVCDHERSETDKWQDEVCQ